VSASIQHDTDNNTPIWNLIFVNDMAIVTAFHLTQKLTEFSTQVYTVSSLAYESVVKDKQQVLYSNILLLFQWNDIIHST